MLLAFVMHTAMPTLTSISAVGIVYAVATSAESWEIGNSTPAPDIIDHREDDVGSWFFTQTVINYHLRTDFR
jgi:hypothetical protein